VAAARQRVLEAGGQLAHRAGGEIVVGDAPRAAEGDVGVEVVVQVRTDRRRLVLKRNAHLPQMCARTDARQQQELRGTIHAARDHDLAATARRPWAAPRPVVHADGTAVGNQDARGMGVGQDDQVGAPA
jgi:hypothetical protein